MRRGDYDEAAVGIVELLDFPELTTGVEAGARLLLAVCLVDRMERVFPRDITVLQEDFAVNLDAYWQAVDKHDGPMGFKPFCDYFEQTIRYTLFEPFESIGKRLLDFLQMFEERSGGIVRRRDLIKVWIAEIDRERRGIDTARTDHLARSIVMGKTLLSLLDQDSDMIAFKITVNKILADTIYYYHAPGKSLNERAQEALFYLEQVLIDVPGDPYALNFQQDINQTLARQSQIDRFNHDSRSILGSLNQTSRKLLSHAEGDEFLARELHMLRRQIMTLRSIAMLAEGQDSALQPSGDEWEDCDISVIIREQLGDLHIPESCLEHKGDPVIWEIIPGMVSVVFENLLKNTLEAYRRNGQEVPRQPCRIVVDYKEKIVHYFDSAGGIDPAVGDIFAPYTSSKAVRCQTGLGLTNAHMAMRGMDGTIELASDAAGLQGVHFILRFG